MNRYLWAVASGLMLAASFPKAEVAGLAWVAPGLLLFCATGVPSRTALRIAYAGGLAFYLAELYWLLFIPLPAAAVCGWVALSCYVALYPALWVWFCLKSFPGTLHRESGHSNSVDTLWTLCRIFDASWAQRAVWACGCAAVWVGLEMVLGRFLSGFPWDFLGVSQYKLLPLIQVAAFTGVYGVSFLVVWFSVGLLCCLLALGRAGGRPSGGWLLDLALPGIVLAVVLAYGLFQVGSLPKPSKTIRAALIQPSIPQTLIWNTNENSARFEQLLRLSKAALKTKPDLLVWPEAALPNMLRHDRDTAIAVSDLVRSHKVWAIVGSDDAEPKSNAPDEREARYFNSGFAINPRGEIAGSYKKRRLVIFGEWVPFSDWLQFLKSMIPAVEASFTPGPAAVPFFLPDLGLCVSVLICFEDTFPSATREYVRKDTDFLLNITNNGWFGESAAQWQHAATAIFRAVENGVPLVRCANNGLTCWVDEVGAMHDVFTGDSKDVYGEGFKTARIPVLGPGETRRFTFYREHGDLFGWSCVAWMTALALKHRPRSRPRVAAQPGQRAEAD